MNSSTPNIKSARPANKYRNSAIACHTLHFSSSPDGQPPMNSQKANIETTAKVNKMRGALPRFSPFTSILVFIIKTLPSAKFLILFYQKPLQNKTHLSAGSGLGIIFQLVQFTPPSTSYNGLIVDTARYAITSQGRIIRIIPNTFGKLSSAMLVFRFMKSQYVKLAIAEMPIITSGIIEGEPMSNAAYVCFI